MSEDEITAWCYDSMASEVEQSFQAGEHEDPYRLARLLIPLPGLQLFHRASLSLILATANVTGDAEIWARQAITHFTMICVKMRSNKASSDGMLLAWRVFHKLKRLKRTYESGIGPLTEKNRDPKVTSQLVNQTTDDLVPNLARNVLPGMESDCGAASEAALGVVKLSLEEPVALRRDRIGVVELDGNAMLRQYVRANVAIINGVRDLFADLATKLENDGDAANSEDTSSNALQHREDSVAHKGKMVQTQNQPSAEYDVIQPRNTIDGIQTKQAVAYHPRVMALKSTKQSPHKHQLKDLQKPVSQVAGTETGVAVCQPVDLMVTKKRLAADETEESNEKKTRVEN